MLADNPRTLRALELAAEIDRRGARHQRKRAGVGYRLLQFLSHSAK